jgi:hypothetical protein
MAQAAYGLGDKQWAWEAVMQAVEDASELYKLDSDHDSPNLAPIEYWPSTQAYRHIVSVAAKLFGADAFALLMGIRSPDLALLAQVEIASTLLGVPSLPSGTLSRHAKTLTK